ncbi:hypothetical protein TBLA_0E04610 [Henningerozyma blattae CBS 6284]|uniref:Uncharacterized protein n=1 Tax=Henningerozyma blattae (strain ATCC 34711 / CBS 6284 / DSM 70876 / NBRC 10599 / NRRL Y-10934 / UCD 77-7) TaxID=1071380 RepID=I2H561_HENB6|nr:hypothetical protein TBLA_0E04610 [Tetrapisispora blattae CBS 6284]CCH61513.1 hypothetical protein TBLA_0E04610 [Tetrapisispora blattae CBS 6284]
MGNTDSKLNNIYKQHIFKLAFPIEDGIVTEKNRIVRNTIFKENITLDELINWYDNTSFNQPPAINDSLLFKDFYLDFIAPGTRLTFESFNKIINSYELRILINSNPLTKENFINLIRFVTFKIIWTIANTSNINQLNLSLKNLLVSIRILTKILPLYYELLSNDKSYQQQTDFFWSLDTSIVFNIQSDIKLSKPIGELLIDSIINNLFLENFTIQKLNSNSKHSLWENGINTNETTYNPLLPKVDSNRLEFINLLLTLFSKDLYSNQPTNNFISYFNLTHKTNSINLINSMINCISRHCLDYKTEIAQPYKFFTLKQHQQQNLIKLRSDFIISSLQFLNLILFNTSSNNNNDNNTNDLKENFILNFISNLQKEYDMKLLLSSIAKIFKWSIDEAIEKESSPFGSFPTTTTTSKPPSTPTNNNNNNNTNNSNNSIISSATITPSKNNRTNNIYFSSNSNSNSRPTTPRSNSANDCKDNSSTKTVSTNTTVLTLPEIPTILIQMMIFFNNLIDLNTCFKNYVADKYANKFIIFSIYYLNYYNHITSLKSNLFPILINLSLNLSSKNLVKLKLLDCFTTNYYLNKLPNFFRLPNININNLTYRDFAIQHLSHYIINDIKKNSKLRPFLFELIFNLLQANNNKSTTDDALIQLSSIKNNNNNKFKKNLNSLSYNSSVAILHLLTKISNKSFLITYSNDNMMESSQDSNNNLLINNTTNNSDINDNNLNSMNDENTYCKTDKYLLSPGFKLNQLALLLRGILNYIIFNFNNAKNLLFILCRHQKVLAQIRNSMEFIDKLIKENSIKPGSTTASNNNLIGLKDYIDNSTINIGFSNKMTRLNTLIENNRYKFSSVQSNYNKRKLDTLDLTNQELIAQYIKLNNSINIIEKNYSIENEKIQAQSKPQSNNSSGSITRTSGSSLTSTIPTAIKNIDNIKTNTIPSPSVTPTPNPLTKTTTNTSINTDTQSISEMNNINNPIIPSTPNNNRTSTDSIERSAFHDLLNSTNKKFNDVANNNNYIHNSANTNNFNNNSNENHEIVEFSNPNYNPFLKNSNIYFGIRSGNWPIGLNPKKISKKASKLNLIDIWPGSQDLQIIIKIIKIFLHQFPEISTINTTEYLNLIEKFQLFKDKFLKLIDNDLPSYLREGNHNFASYSIKFDYKSKDNLPKIKSNLLQRLMYIICWKNIFDSHTTSYNISNDLLLSTTNEFFNSNKDSTNKKIIGNLKQFSINTPDLSPPPFTFKNDVNPDTIVNPSDSLIIGPKDMIDQDKISNNINVADTVTITTNNTIPPGSLEKWSSSATTSSLSRTSSKESEILNYLSNQNDVVLPPQFQFDIILPIDTPIINTLINNINNDISTINSNDSSTRNKYLLAQKSNPSTSSSNSFFNFSWAGFRKDENSETSSMNASSPMRSSFDDENSDAKRANSANNMFVLDQGLIKSNIWAGTNITLFPIIREEREEFSLLDMTSNLLKKLKFGGGSSTSVNSVESPTATNSPLVSHPAGLTRTPSRPWTPRTRGIDTSKTKDTDSALSTPTYIPRRFL